MTWIDWLFLPLTWLVGRLIAQTGESLPPGVEGVATVFLWTSMVAFSGVVCFSILASLVLRWTDAHVEDAIRWSIKGSDLSTYMRFAARYVGLQSTLMRIHGWTGVTWGTSPHRSDQIPGIAKSSVTRQVVRRLLALPIGISLVLRTAWAWVRHPVGAYVLAGALWMPYRPGFEAAVQGGKGLVASLAAPQGMAVLAVLFAAAAVALDHGLTPRIRGRNLFQQQQAAAAEELLQEMRSVAQSFAKHLQAGLDSVIRTRDRILGSAVEHVTQGSFTVHDGRVRESSGRSQWSRRMPGDPDWAAKEPLRDFEPGSGPWDPADNARRDFTSLCEVVRDSRHFHTLMRQVPRSGRALLWECLPGRLPRFWTADPLPVWAYRLSREHLERQVQGIIGDHKLLALLQEPSVELDGVQLRVRLDELVRESVEATEDTAWGVSVLYAETARFVDAVAAWQRPIGWRGRLGRRLG